MGDLDTEVLLMGHEIITMEGDCNRLSQELEERKVQEENKVRPRIDSLQKDISVLELDIKSKLKMLESCK